MRVLVCTVVHHPADARIYFRQIRALLDAGHEVTYIAPLDAGELPPLVSGTEPAERDVACLRTVGVPRAVGRNRIAALRAARRQLAAHAPRADLLLVHDPELLLVLPRRRPPTVWDVHEDTAAALSTKAWLPAPLRPAAAAGVIAAERLAERRLHLILAEDGYNDRFRREHPVVRNTTYVPEQAAAPDRERRVVYVGHLSPDRGSAEMVALARLLAPHGIAVHLVGPADPQASAQIQAAADVVRWHGFVPNAEAMRFTDGALAGLSLLHDEPNFQHSMPTKVIEYMARGVPVISSPLPLAAGLVGGYRCGYVVPFGDTEAARDAVLALDADPALRVAMGARGHDAALRSLGWPADARAFVAQLERWAAPAPGAASGATPATPAPRPAQGR